MHVQYPGDMCKPDSRGDAAIDPGEDTVFLVGIHETESPGKGDFANYI